MEGFLGALYEYAQEREVTAYLEAWEYRRIMEGLEEDWAAFRAALTAEQDRRLEALLARERDVEELGESAVFRCGLSMGIGLGRL